MAYRGRKKFKKKPRKEMQGLQVEVYNNNVDKALRIFKKKVKESGLMLELKKRTFYEKPSKIKREKRNMQKSRYRYLQETEKTSSF